MSREVDQKISDRNIRLFESDWTQLPDTNLYDEEKKSWAIYRKELRNLKITEKNVKDLVWPVYKAPSVFSKSIAVVKESGLPYLHIVLALSVLLNLTVVFKLLAK